MALENVKCCSTCFWYDGKPGDGNQFCDESGVYVNEKSCCGKWKEKTNPEEMVE